jgi:hypothetical protein
VTGLEQGLIITFFGVALTAIIALLVRMNARIIQQGAEIKVLQVQVSPFWAQVQARMSVDLHHPNPQYHEMDELLEKLESLTITIKERERLKTLLIDRSLDMNKEITQDQRMKAKLMIQVMDFVVTEAREKEG